MIPEEILRQYNMGTLEWYEENHGKSDETTKMFYQTFLSQTDYETNKMKEYETYLELHPGDEKYIELLNNQRVLLSELSIYRQFAREEIND